MQFFSVLFLPCISMPCDLCACVTHFFRDFCHVRWECRTGAIRLKIKYELHAFRTFSISKVKYLIDASASVMCCVVLVVLCVLQGARPAKKKGERGGHGRTSGHRRRDLEGKMR